MSMSVCANPEEDSASEESGAPVRDIYEQKSGSTVVRVLTVLAYLLSVSLAAILLSVYYVCVWKSPALPPAAGRNETQEAAVTVSARRADQPGGHAGAPVSLRLLGGSNLTMRDPSSEEPFESETFQPTNESAEPPDVPPSASEYPEPEPTLDTTITSEDYLLNATTSLT